MPIFDFECRGCGSQFEELCLTPNDPVECPECGGKNAQRQLSVFAAHTSSETACGQPSDMRGACAMADNGNCACSLS